MQTLAKTSAVALALVASISVTAHAQYYNSYYGTPNTPSWSAYNSRGSQRSALETLYYYYSPGYVYSYNYPTYSYAQGVAIPGSPSLLGSLRRNAAVFGQRWTEGQRPRYS